MFRKHFNSMQVNELGSANHFFSWECITLQFGLKNVDLVIKDEYEMKLFLRYLIYSLRTLDGYKNSANNLLKAMDLEEEDKYRRENKKQNITEYKLLEIK